MRSSVGWKQKPEGEKAFHQVHLSNLNYFFNDFVRFTFDFISNRSICENSHPG